jgi:hypothetical protein
MVGHDNLGDSSLPLRTMNNGKDDNFDPFVINLINYNVGRFDEFVRTFTPVLAVPFATGRASPRCLCAP